MEGEPQMNDPMLALAIGAGALAALSFVLARLIPDDYDRSNPRLSLGISSVDRAAR